MISYLSKESRILANGIPTELRSSKPTKFTDTLHMLRSEIEVDFDKAQIHPLPYFLNYQKGPYSSASFHQKETKNNKMQQDAED